MFYKKNDTEILCETLIKLVDRHDKMVEKRGLLAAVSHQRAIDILLRKIESDLSRPIIGAKSAIQTNTKKFIDNNKSKLNRFSGIPAKPKATITVLHGASDDIKQNINKESIDIKEKKEITPLETVKPIEQKQEFKIEKPIIPSGVPTPENIDSMADQLSA